MSKQMSQIKVHLDTLRFKYPNNDISYSDGDNQLDIKVDDNDIILEHEVLNEGYEDHGIKFINGIASMVEDEIVQNNEQKDIPEDSKE